MCVVSVVPEIDMPMSTSLVVTERVPKTAPCASNTGHATAVGAQSLAFVAPALLLVSAGHAVQSLSPGVSLYLPAAHMVHVPFASGLS
jgi:hypothetical protein